MIIKASYVTVRPYRRRWTPALMTPPLLLVLFLALLGQASPAHAGTLTACATGGQYATIQAAINAAAAGDVIQICAGTYAEEVDLGGMATPGDITLIGVGNVTVTATAPALSINGSFPGRVTLVNIHARSIDAESVSLFSDITGGLVITGGSMASANSSGLYVAGIAGPVTISGTAFNENAGTGLFISSQAAPPGCGTPGAGPEAVRLTNIAAARNGSSGVVVTAIYGGITISGSYAGGNGEHGFSLISYDPCSSSPITVHGSHAEGNGSVPAGYGSGFDLRGQNVVVDYSSAVGNACDGIVQGYNSPALLAAGVGGASGVCGDVPPAPRPATASSAVIPAGITGGATPLRTIEIFNTTVTTNGNHGINVGAVGFVTITSVSAISNTVDGIRLPYTALLQPGLRSNDFGVSTMTAVIADSLTISNSVGIELNDNLLLYPAGPGPEVPGITAVVGGNIVCANTSAGLAATGNVSHTFDAGSNYWGSSSGPRHAAKNPGGSGNQVVDATNTSTFANATGDVLLAPWIESGDSVISPPVGIVGQPQEVAVFFPAGVMPGITRGPGDPNGGPIYTIATNNGVLTTTFGSGVSAPAAIGSGGVLTASLFPATEGAAAVTVSGPCGLTYTTTFSVIAPSINVVKSAGTDPDACATPGPVTVPISSSVYYCLNVINTGNVTLTHHLVTDAQLGVSNAPVTYTLPPGASVPITRSLLPALGPVVMAGSLTNVVAITSTAVFTELGNIVIEPELAVAVQSAGAVRVTAQPTGLDPTDEPVGDRRLYLPALGR